MSSTGVIMELPQGVLEILKKLRTAFQYTKHVNGFSFVVLIDIVREFLDTVNNASVGHEQRVQ